MSDVVYFSKMFQAVPHLAQVAGVLPGTFVTSRRSTISAVRNLYPHLDIAAYSKFFGPWRRGNRLLRDAQVIVTGSPYRDFLAPYHGKKCTVFHGTYTLLSREALLKNSHFDLLCVIGPRMRSMIERYAADLDLNTVETGFLPFCEFPDRSVSFTAQTLASLGLDPARQTVLYTPSRRGVGSWEVAAEHLLRTAPAHFNLIMRPHPSQGLTPRAADRALGRRLMAQAAVRGNALIDLSSQPLSAMLAISDVVVSDANSPAEESMFYDLPLVFLETERLGRKAALENGLRHGLHQDHIDMRLSFFETGICMSAQAGLDFSTVLDEAISRSAEFSPRRLAYFSWVFGQRDKCANERVAAAIKTHLLN
ncbi:hypothetical protein NGA35_02460 [Pseudomonas stutzeri]|nr:hypothetical protein [Stutzerimonas stutzeri]